MRATLVSILSLSSLVAACGGDNGGDDNIDPSPAFDMDVVVTTGLVDIWVRQPDPTCEPEQQFPHAGECASYVDSPYCSGPRDPCDRRFTIERDGAVVAEALPSLGFSPFHIPMSDGPAELVIERCTDSHRIALPPPPLLAPVLTDVTIDGVELSGTVSTAAGTTGTLAAMNFSLGGYACHSTSPDTWNLRPLIPGELAVSAVRAFETSATPWGVARMWTIARAVPTIPIAIPTRVSDDRWRLDLPTPPTFTVEVDGAPFEDGRWTGLTWEIVMTSSGPRHQITNGPYFVYETGETTDRFRMHVPGAFHSATFSHVVPSNDLEFSLDDDGRFQLSVGPVTMTNEEYPTATREITFTLAADHPVIPRPRPLP